MLRPLVEPGEFVSIRYPERLADAREVASIRVVGDSYDDAKVESLELYEGRARSKKGLGGVDDLELDNLNLGPLVHHPPAAHRDRLRLTDRVRAGLLPSGLHP